MNKKIKVLYVDDELNNLNSFKATFRKEYQITTAISAMEAIKILETERFEIIISDQRMPGITGIEFFEKLILENQDPMRILLTGYTDIQAVVDAINKGHVYRYLTKPWSEHDIRLAIDTAFDHYTVKKALEQRNKDLQKAYNDLDKFIYSASHDLRAPVATILGLTNVAKIENQSNEYIELIEQVGNRLDNFLADILEYYKINKGQNQSKAIDFNNLLDNLLIDISLMPDAKEVIISNQVDQDSTFFSDELMMNAIMRNILSNAVKYQRPNNQDKKIKIDISVSKTEAKISVNDNGIGIEPGQQNKIFDMFYRGTRMNQGSGLGLFIVKESVERLNGSIVLESDIELGTKVVITLPNSA